MDEGRGVPESPPECDAVGKNALDVAVVEVHQNLKRQMSVCSGRRDAGVSKRGPEKTPLNAELKLMNSGVTVVQVGEGKM